jgi:SAM-dependent methyltransferase
MSIGVIAADYDAAGRRLGNFGRVGQTGSMANEHEAAAESLDSPSTLPVMDQDFWDERYRSAPRMWSGDPNPQLVADTAGLEPGSALDVGCGEGGDAIWLAQQGWGVTAVDISEVAIERARSHAAAAGDDVARRIEWVRADLEQWDPPVARFDLVSVQFMHLPSAVRVPLYDRLASAVAPGGILLVVGHHPSDLETSVRRPPIPDFLFTAEQVADRLGEGWTLLDVAARPRPAVDAAGLEVTVHDAVLVARRAG